jgi:hypothetical protein
MAIAGKINVTMGVTTVDLHVGAQTVRLRIEDAQELARKLADTAAGCVRRYGRRGRSRGQPQLAVKISCQSRCLRNLMVPRKGLEPPTHALRI